MKVELIAYTPNPDDVCGIAARTCTSKSIPSKGELYGDWSKSENALRSALKSGHTSVLDHVSFTFAVEGVSRACSHQLVRQRIGVGISQQSQRYVDLTGFDFVTPKSIDNSDKEVPFSKLPHPDGTIEFVNVNAEKAYRNLMYEAQDLYKMLVDAGIPEEDARYVIPNACCTNLTFTLSGTALKHFFERRLCRRAQWEIRKVAEAMFEQVEKVAPVMAKFMGPQCHSLGYCPEKKSCRDSPTYEELYECWDMAND